MANEENTQTPEERAASLLNAIGDRVMGADGGTWDSRQPLPNDPSAAHAAEMEQRSAASKEQKPDTEQKQEEKIEEELYLGKYKTKEEAINEMHELKQYAKTAADRAEQAERSQQELASRLANAINPQQGDGKASDPRDELEAAAALPRQPFSRAVRAEMEEYLGELLKPHNEKVKADQEIIKNYPEYVEELPNIVKWLEAHPEIRDDVLYAENKGEYLMARKYAINMYKAEKGREEKIGEKVEERKAKAQEAKADAGLIGGSSTVPQVQEKEPELSAERLNYLINLKRQGHTDPLLRETLGRMLTQQGWDNL